MWAQKSTQSPSAWARVKLAIANGANLVGFTWGTGYTAGTVGRWLEDLALSTGAGFIGWIQAGVGATLRVLRDKVREHVSVKDFGADGDDATNDTAAFEACMTYCIANNAVMRVPRGTYLLDAGTNFGAEDFSMVGEGKPTLHFTGAGDAFLLDAGGAGALFNNMRVSGFFLKGNAATTNIYRARGIVRSYISDIEVGEGTDVGFLVQFGVSTHYRDCKISGNTYTATTLPARGWKLDNDGTAGYYTANCTFTNCIGEGLPAGRGLSLEDASGNQFNGGTFEGCAIGADIENAQCRRNVFRGVWFEANTNDDIRVRGVGNRFEDIYAGSASVNPSVDIITGTGTVFAGGFVREVRLQATSSDSEFFGVGFSDNVALGITGTGTHKRVGCTLLDVNLNITGKYADMVGDSYTFVPAGLRQNVNVATSVATGSYRQTGKLVQARCALTANGAGTAANAIVVDLPAALQLAADQVGLPIGVAHITIGGTVYTATVVPATATALTFQAPAVANLVGVTPGITLAVGSTVLLSFVGELA